MSTGHVPAAPRPVDDAHIAELRSKLRGTRQVTDPWAGDATRGAAGPELIHLLDRWVDGYDWRVHEERIRSLPWQLVPTAGGELRVVHQRASNVDAPVVVLLHGWPDSVLRFERLLPELNEFTVVVPALPGFPFAASAALPVSVNDLATIVVEAMTSLGHDRFVVSGGDIGGTVAEIIAGQHPDRVTALHLTDVSPHHARAVDPDALSSSARAYLGRAADWFRTDGAYIAVQSTRPSTLLTALGDSPAGLAAWLFEKLRDWSDDVKTSFTTDELLTWISAYWYAGCIGSSLSTYTQPATVPQRTAVPTTFSAFPADIKPAPREYVAAFVNLVDFTTHDAGGHFAAWEQPRAYAEGLRAAFSATH